VRRALEFGVIALIALAVVVLPGGGSAVDVLITALIIAFFVAIAMLGYRLYREHRFTLFALAERDRVVLYVSIAVAFLAFTATRRLFDEGGLGILAWLAMLALASYGVFWVLLRSRRYE
jgi:hypothetical protein